MPTPRKTIAALKLSGSYQRNPGRYRHLVDPKFALKSPRKAPLGSAPAHLSAPAKAVWAEISKAAPKGLLTRAHRISVEVLVGLVLKLREGNAKSGEVNSLLNALTRFGLSPESVGEPAKASASHTTDKDPERRAWDALDELD